MLAAVTQGLADDDDRFVCSPWFIHMCCYIGLDPDTALRIKIAYLKGEVDPKRLTMTNLHAERYRGKDPRSGQEAHWRSWSAVS
ncbi:hypothetical protein [Variovorax saccharolyticus]|uniref:hypothetical protein n=1 Tax=Variovorax saccharolyticus TaxID=3053516 RepID=UPI0025760C2B|nr:hypothetical protein [Variovorax sp. J22R187]MDM0018175.1 hypothetical protein [Variovorax sp. J22R187]